LKVLQSQITNRKSQMKVVRQFERRGPLWLPRYEVERPERGLPRFERYRRRVAPQPAASWGFVNNNSGGSGTASSYTLSLGWTPSAGDLLVVMAGATTSGVLFSISDNSSGPADSWSTLTGVFTFGPSGGYQAQAFATNVTSGTAPTQVKVSLSSGSAHIYIQVAEYSGGPNPYVLDGTVSTNGDGGTSGQHPTASYTTTSSGAGALLWGPAILQGGPSTVSVGSPFTYRSTTDKHTASADDMSGVAASTQYTVTYSLSGNSYWACCLAAFLPQSATFQPDEDYWQGPSPGAPDSPVTVWG
jgi:hypothetical protein